MIYYHFFPKLQDHTDNKIIDLFLFDITIYLINLFKLIYCINSTTITKMIKYDALYFSFEFYTIIVQ